MTVAEKIERLERLIRADVRDRIAARDAQDFDLVADLTESITNRRARLLELEG